MSIKANFPDIKPSLMLDFANTKRLDPRITFTRATTATYYDGKTVAKAEENLLLRSQDYSATWTVTNLTPVTAKTAPDGTSTATEFTASSANGVLTQGFTAVAGSYTFSVFLRRVTGSGDIEIAADNGTFTVKVITGTWARYDVTQTVAAGSKTAGVRVVTSGDVIEVWGAQLEQRSAVTAYTPTTDQPITNYIPVLQSAASGEARFDHDPVTGESKGLLIEEQRTNLVLNSTNPADASYFSTGTSNAIRSSNICFFDPASNMVELQGISGESSSNIWGRNTTFSTASRTVSLIVKNINNARYVRVRNRSFDGRTCVSYDLETQTVIGSSDINTTSITNIGNGFYRIVFSTTAAGTIAGIYVSLVDSSNAVFTMTGSERLFVASPQIELGAFPTSYIPTVASQVTRNADAATMTGTNFSSWYRADEGSFYAEAMPANIAQNPYIFTAESDISNLIQSIASSTFHFRSFVGGVTQADIDAGTFSDNTYGKVAGVYKVNDFAVSLNSGTVGTDTDGLIPFPTTLYIGADSSAVRCITIKKLAYYPARLSNTELQGLTS
jgi:hypothetical protein